MEKVTTFIDKARGGLGRLAAYFGEVGVEFKRITWPGRQELKESTVVVIVFIIILAVAIAVIDYLVKHSLQVIHG